MHLHSSLTSVGVVDAHHLLGFGPLIPRHCHKTQCLGEFPWSKNQQCSALPQFPHNGLQQTPAAEINLLQWISPPDKSLTKPHPFQGIQVQNKQNTKLRIVSNWAQSFLTDKSVFFALIQILFCSPPGLSFYPSTRLLFILTLSPSWAPLGCSPFFPRLSYLESSTGCVVSSGPSQPSFLLSCQPPLLGFRPLNTQHRCSRSGLSKQGWLV